MRIGEGIRRVSPPPHDPRPSASSPDATGPPTGEEPSPFALLVRRLGREVDRGEALTRKAIEGGGKDLGSGELLALQAGVYRYSEAVDLSAKLVDRASSGVKTVLQGQ